MKLEKALVIMLIILVVLAVVLIDWEPQPVPVFRGGW